MNPTGPTDYDFDAFDAGIIDLEEFFTDDDYGVEDYDGDYSEE